MLIISNKYADTQTSNEHIAQPEPTTDELARKPPADSDAAQTDLPPNYTDVAGRPTRGARGLSRV